MWQSRTRAARARRYEEVGVPVPLGLQLHRRDFRSFVRRLSAVPRTFVIDQPGTAGPPAAHRTVGSFASLSPGTEASGHRTAAAAVSGSPAPTISLIVSIADRAMIPGARPTRLPRAPTHESGRSWRKTPVARLPWRRTPTPASNRRSNRRRSLAEQYARIVHQVASREVVVRPHDVEIADDIERVSPTSDASRTSPHDVRFNPGCARRRLGFGFPTALVPWMIWRCRFVLSPTRVDQAEASPTRPAARLERAGEQEPPAPTAARARP